MAKATAISFSFTPHIHSGSSLSQDGELLLYAFAILLLHSIKNFFSRHIRTVFDKVNMYNVVKERNTRKNHKI